MSITDTTKWRAVYNDDTFLDEGEEEGHGWKNIDFKNLKIFKLLNSEGTEICQVNLGGDKRIIFTRRNLIQAGQKFVKRGDVKILVPVKALERIIILGWQKTVNGVNVKAIFYIMPDGRIEMDDEWHEDSTHIPVTTPTEF